MRRRAENECVAGGVVGGRLRDMLDAEPLQQFDDAPGRQLEPEQALDLRRTQGDEGRTADRTTVHTRHLGGLDGTGRSARDGEQQRRRALDGEAPDLGVDTALETLAGIGGEAVSAPTPGDGCRREPGHFEQHTAGLGRDAGPHAAHHAGERHGTGRIGDDEFVGGERHGTAVQQVAGLTGRSETHGERATHDLVEIVGVHRLAELEHDVVGDVDHRADAALTGAAQTLAQPQRRRSRVVDIEQHARVETRTGRRRRERDRRALGVARSHRGDRPTALQPLSRGTRHTADGQSRDRTDLARETAHRHGVTAVRGDSELEDGVIETERRAQVCAHGQIGRQFEDALGGLGKTEFLRRAQHAGGLDAAQLRGLDAQVAGQHRAHLRERRAQTGARVGRAADDLQFRTARRHAADLQLVGLRVALGGEDLGDHHPAERRRGWRDRLELEARHGHARAEFGGRQTRIDGFFEPIEGELHAAPNWRRKRRSLS